MIDIHQQQYETQVAEIMESKRLMYEQLIAGEIEADAFQQGKSSLDEMLEYLITDENGRKLSDGQYRLRFKAIMEQLGFSHCPHECRHTLRSRLDSARANKKCIDIIIDHKSKDVGERVYTHNTIEELKQAIELISR